MIDMNVNLNSKTILITGSPGFIGANLVLQLFQNLSSGHILSFDNIE